MTEDKSLPPEQPPSYETTIATTGERQAGAEPSARSRAAPNPNDKPNKFSSNCGTSTGCTMSSACKECQDCSMCSNCLRCVGCKMCSNCVDCEDCVGCTNCSGLKGAKYCSNEHRAL
ncbi:hypothetical protein EV356DRAFT_503222 [Viridothelium virens]|uniref:Uncharacterized protein n=1 Tax=Viridothelium virens TaxID=1048519 RepID=A0A6A6H6J6_VIRVR|nr:hypothetical protein EV356DRAFT_503222 [Viridothelium virens]